MKYQHLESACRIGSMTVKNRLIMTAAGCEMTGPNGTITEEYLAYYEARAKGGVGAIITELMQVDPVTGVMNPRQVRLWSDESIPELTKLADRLHKYDCRVIVQLQHPGNVAVPKNIGGKTPVSASDVPGLSFRQTVRPMSREEIHALVEAFGDAAYRAKQAGIDGVEFHASHFYLLHQFLSPYFNHRSDEYGGTLENRLRILKEILENARKKVGENYPLLVRISAEEYLQEGGYHLNEGISICQAVESYGADAINVTAAGNGCQYGQSLEPASFEQGWRKHLARAVRQLVKIPVIGVAVIREPQYAEKMIAEGYMDFVGSARNYIADPEWAEKAFSGREDEICPCISCLRCIQGVVSGGSISCSVNPLCGREKAMEQAAGGEGKRIIVLGGGPAGMTAALTASKCGFDVNLFEASAELGGQLRLASRAPRKDKIARYLSFLHRELDRSGVEVCLNKKLTESEIRSMDPYAVIDATGAISTVPQQYAEKGNYVYPADEILSGAIELEDKNVVIVGTGMTGLETAEYLSERHNAVTLVGRPDRLAPTAYPTQVRDITKHLILANTVFLTSTALESVENGYICIRDKKSDSISQLPADCVVLALGVHPAQPYGDSLTDLRYIKVGDAVRSGGIMEAVRSGYDAVFSIAQSV